MVTFTVYSGLSFFDFRKISCVLLFGILWSFRVQAQEFSKDLDFDDPNQVHVLETRRGDRFIGKVKNIQDQSLSFLIREDNLLIFKFNEIERVYPFSATEDGERFYPTYLSFFPTAYNLPQGVWEYQNNSLLWNTIYYGVNEHFSLGGGFIIPAFFTLRLKYTAEVSERFSVGVQNQNLIALFSGLEPSLSNFALVGTLGRADKFINIGTGLLIPWTSTDELVPVFSLGHGRRLGRRAGFHLELNLIAVDGDLSLSPTGAFNYFGKNNRLSLGVSMEALNTLIGFFAIPIVSYNQRF